MQFGLQETEMMIVEETLGIMRDVLLKETIESCTHKDTLTETTGLFRAAGILDQRRIAVAKKRVELYGEEEDHV